MLYVLLSAYCLLSVLLSTCMFCRLLFSASSATVPQPVEGIFSSEGVVSQEEIVDDISCSGTEEVPQLTDNNFREWCEKVKVALKSENLWTVIEGTLCLDPAASPKFVKLFYQRKIKAVRIIIQSIPAVLSNILFGSLSDDDIEDPVLVWNVVNDYFDSKAAVATNVHSFEPNQSISIDSASLVSSLQPSLVQSDQSVESVNFFSDGCPVGCKEPCEHFVSHYPSDSDENPSEHSFADYSYAPQAEKECATYPRQGVGTSIGEQYRLADKSIFPTLQDTGKSASVEETHHLEVKFKQQNFIMKKKHKKKKSSKKRQKISNQSFLY